MKKEEIRKLLNLDETLNVIKIETKEEKGKKVKLVSVKSNKNKARCSNCNQFSHKIHDYLKPNKIVYLDNSGEKTYLITYKRRFECKKCNKSFTEDLGLTNNKGKITLKVKQKILKDLMDRDKTIVTIAKENNVSEPTVREIFLEATKNYPEYVTTLPEILSFDETSTYTSEGVYSFILNDPMHKITLDILKNRKKDYLITYFMKINRSIRLSVKVVICDLYEAYYEVVKICFPNAIFIADPFHYTRYVLDGLDKVRIRIVNEYKDNKKSYEYKILKNRLNRKLLLKSFNETKGEKKQKEHQQMMYDCGRSKKQPKDKFNDYWYGNIRIKRNDKYIEITRIDRLTQILDINKEVAEAYALKEEFLRITTNVKYENAKTELKEWIKKCNHSNIPEMIEASKTIKNWINEIVNSFLDERYSNGFTESNNNTITKIVDRAYGYKNFEFFRKRALVILHQSYSGGSRKNIEKGRDKI